MWPAERTGDLETQAQVHVFAIAKRLLDAHALRVQPDNRLGTQYMGAFGGGFCFWYYRRRLKLFFHTP